MKVDGYLIDCATEERLTYAATLTKYPVEKGAKASDHIITEMPVLEIDGIVSDTPIGRAATDPSRTALEGVLPSLDAFEFFKAIRTAEEPVIVECSYGKFDNMVMTSLAPHRDVTTLKAFAFSVKFEQIDIRETRRVTIRTNTGGKKNLGNQPVTKVNGATVEGVIYCITFPIERRDFATKGYGKPAATDISVVKTVTKEGIAIDIPRPPFDCYRVLPGREKNAEGYLTPVAGGGGNAGKMEFHLFSALYDPATDSRKDLEANNVSTTPVPKTGSKKATKPAKQPVKRGWWNEKEAK